MSRRTVLVTVEATWQASDRLRLYRGSENAASLAASTPHGGAEVMTKNVGNVQPGSTIALSFEYIPSDVCATLPVGVSCLDGSGNESAVLETVIEFMDPPEPPGRPDVAATENPGEAQLSWLASSDL